MDWFRNGVMLIENFDGFDGPVTAARKTRIENHLREFFTNIHTPDHPTYTAMIHKAIKELNEEEGSSKNSISEFIRKEYDDLPCAHSTVLDYHMEKLFIRERK
ncbi:hypothetical protein F0562_033457 [Nyssa sinensis]|uniref:H15 domain-containing protein n=1 Tax=Nyssa sinensis TaxID=561372 RepID=A0A5J5ADH3_9ASTE|nr:hypothetical protein F0562_033457 [Nyssa sinensis]